MVNVSPSDEAEHHDYQPGIPVPVGISYRRGQQRLAFFGELAPILDPASPASLGWGGGIGIRFYFGRQEAMAAYIVHTPSGRALLHLAAALRAGHWSWHVAGIIREVGQARMRHARQVRLPRGKDGEGCCHKEPGE